MTKIIPPTVLLRCKHDGELPDFIMVFDYSSACFFEVFFLGGNEGDNLIWISEQNIFTYQADINLARILLNLEIEMMPYFELPSKIICYLQVEKLEKEKITASCSRSNGEVRGANY